MFSSIVHISPTTSLVVGTNPPAHPQWHDAVLDLHAHEYTAVHTRGQHPFSPFHISLLCIFMCIVGTWNMLLFTSISKSTVIQLKVDFNCLVNFSYMQT